MEYQEIPDNPQFDDKIQKISESTLVHADVMNAFLNKLVQNDVFLKKNSNALLNQIVQLISELKLSMIPVGYIFTWEPTSDSTVDLSTSQKVHDHYGFGIWELIKDRFLIGAEGGYEISSTGGEAVHTLSAAEMPSHAHNYAGNTDGNNVDHVHGGATGTVSADHTHGGYTSTNGNHNHLLYAKQDNNAGGNNWRYGTAGQNNGASGDAISWAGDHNHTIQTYGIGAANHVHGFTTGGQSIGHVHSYSGNTSATGSGVPHNNMPPYKAVYIWKRIA